MHCVKRGEEGGGLCFACTIAAGRDNDMRSRKDSSTVRGVCWGRAGRSRECMCIARGRPPRDANTHTRARAYTWEASQTCTRNRRGGCVSFYPACFRVRIVTNKRATRKRDLYIARNYMTVVCDRLPRSNAHSR